MSTDRILLTGSSGLIGTSLVRSLETQTDFNNFACTGVPCPAPATRQLWDPYAATPVSRPEALEGTTAAVHLSGANLAGRRWTSAYKREILESRVKPTHALATLLAGLRPKPAVLVCASAIGIYGGRGDEVLTEASLPGTGFLPEVAWPGKRRRSRPRMPGSGWCISVLGWCFRPKGAPWPRCCPSFAPDWAVGWAAAGSGSAGLRCPMRLGRSSLHCRRRAFPGR